GALRRGPGLGLAVAPAPLAGALRRRHPDRAHDPRSHPPRRGSPGPGALRRRRGGTQCVAATAGPPGRRPRRRHPSPPHRARTPRRAAAAPRRQGPAAAIPALNPRLKAYAEFEYTGATALTVEGPMTGKRYRWNGPGAIVTVDLLDRRAVATVPHLREV